MNLPVVAGAISTSLFVASMLPMLVKASRTKDLSYEHARNRYRRDWRRHAGLAVSAILSSASRDHVVLDRGRVAERWRTERWDSLRLLTTNRMSCLTGWSYLWPDQDGYLSAAPWSVIWNGTRRSPSPSRRGPLSSPYARTCPATRW